MGNVRDPHSEPFGRDRVPGTDVADVKDAMLSYLLHPFLPHDKMWTSIIGTFELYVTVDKIDCCKKTATIRYWMYNNMSEKSFGVYAEKYKALKVNENVFSSQHMWWNWTEKHDFSGPDGAPACEL